MDIFRKLRILKNQLENIYTNLCSKESIVISSMGISIHHKDILMCSYFLNGEISVLNVTEANMASVNNSNAILFMSNKDIYKSAIQDIQSILEINDQKQEIVLVLLGDDGNLSTSKVYHKNAWHDIDSIAIIGDDIMYPLFDYSQTQIDSNKAKTAQVFGNRTTELLSKLSIGIVGISGTGSIVAEQLFRMQVGKLVLVDDDIIELKNLGRILNSSKQASDNGINKAVMMKNAYDSYGLTPEIVAIPKVLSDEESIKNLAQCDIIIGCMDSIDGRHHLNLLSSYYVIPYFDVGVKLVSDGLGNVNEVTTATQYIIPGKSSLISRGVYNADSLYSSELLRANPEEYKKRLKEKYIEGANENSPAVISVNMVAASMTVMEVLARLHPFREEENEQYETIYVDLMTPRIVSDKPSTHCKSFARLVGKGDTEPLLGLVK